MNDPTPAEIVTAIRLGKPLVPRPRWAAGPAGSMIRTDGVPVLLPDADHIHLARQHDGTFTAVAMEFVYRTVTVEPFVTRRFGAWVDVEDGAE